MKKVVLITGASSGIGLQTAELLVQQGFIVYGAARRLEKMESLKVSGVRLLQMDVTDEASMAKGIQEILETENRIDVLINNAGYGSYGALEDVPLSEAKYQFEVNVFGLARLTQLLLPHMRSQKSGRIINIASIAGKIGEPHGSWYHATKFAVEGLSDCLRMELRQFGIEVVLIEPGPIKTEWNVIAEQNLAKTSGQTAYADMVNKHIRMFQKMYQNSPGPMVVAQVLVKAVCAKHPKTRYVAGSAATFILLARRLFSDKLFDKVLLSQMR
jgi:short-subunit dehydrogenase